MSFQDFTFPQVQQDLGLTVDEADLFAHAAHRGIREEFVAALTEGTNLALAVNTEKAKSEFVDRAAIAGIAAVPGGSFRPLLGGGVAVDPSRGLTASATSSLRNRRDSSSSRPPDRDR